MTYFVDIFSVDTYEAFSRTDKTIAGFHPKRRAWVTKIKPGDKIVCYLKGLSCWVGLLEVTGPISEAQLGEETVAEYSLQFPVTPVTWLEKGCLIAVKRPDVWAVLSFTKDVPQGAGGWNAILRSSGVRLPEADGQTVEDLLARQAHNPLPDDITDDEWEKKHSFKIKNPQGKEVSVQIPEPDAEGEVPAEPAPETCLPDDVVQVRTSHKMQALLANIGLALGFQVWIPKSDKEAVASMMVIPNLLSTLPYVQLSEPAAVKTVEQIDVLWLQKKTIVRAFEVEHTTAVYSGILRMADLLALQPNFHTKLHIVAPQERRKKVFQELMRPAFSIFPQGPLSELCTYLPYEKVQELAENPNLEYLKQEILDKFEEFAEETE